MVRGAGGGGEGRVDGDVRLAVWVSVVLFGHKGGVRVLWIWRHSRKHYQLSRNMSSMAERGDEQVKMYTRKLREFLSSVQVESVTFSSRLK